MKKVLIDSRDLNYSLWVGQSSDEFDRKGFDYCETIAHQIKKLKQEYPNDAFLFSGLRDNNTVPIHIENKENSFEIKSDLFNYKETSDVVLVYCNSDLTFCYENQFLFMKNKKNSDIYKLIIPNDDNAFYFSILREEKENLFISMLREQYVVENNTLTSDSKGFDFKKSNSLFIDKVFFNKKDTIVSFNEKDFFLDSIKFENDEIDKIVISSEFIEMLKPALSKDVFRQIVKSKQLDEVLSLLLNQQSTIQTIQETRNLVEDKKSIHICYSKQEIINNIHSTIKNSYYYDSEVLNTLINPLISLFKKNQVTHKYLPLKESNNFRIMVESYENYTNIFDALANFDFDNFHKTINNSIKRYNCNFEPMKEIKIKNTL